MSAPRLLQLNKRPWYIRLPAKWTIFLLTVLVVCFPWPAAFVRHVQRWRDPNALVQPEAPEIKALADELRPRLTDELPPAEVLWIVEQFVYKKLPYAWDWDTWGMADYIPTVEEALRSGREDCDGRAVVAASLLRNLGFKADLVSDFAHVWVKTDRGDTMSPRPTTAIVATPEGPKVQWAALGALPRAAAYGVAVFPLARELMIVVVAWLLLVRGGPGRPVRVLGFALMVAGLLCLRKGGVIDVNPQRWMQFSGVGLWAVGALVSAWPRKSALNPGTNSSPTGIGLSGS